MTEVINQWSTIKPFVDSSARGMFKLYPDEDRDRLASYYKYDQIYWNDPRSYSLRVLDGEEPLYIPNARIISETTAYYLLKGLRITTKGSKDEETFLQDFLKRETFYSRFNVAKLSGVVKGDFVFHMTANPNKPEGTRISLIPVDPANVFPIWDDDDPNHMIGCHLAQQYTKPNDPENKLYMRVLTYLQEDKTSQISREEIIYTIDEDWWGPKAKKYKVIIKKGFLDSRITTIPVYWFRNKDWLGDQFGSSELRGLETISQTISQGSTDISAALALEGLGVYATDGGRPVNDDGTETDWEVAPGKVMEVPTGSYFRRVEGVGSITPAKDQIDYLEDKLYKSTGLTDVALGTVDPVSAQSGIALAIKFSPTLAKIETRDQEGIDRLTQLFYDWKTWVEVFERKTLSGDIVPVIGDKLPTDRVARLNELNNMFDRRIISAAFFRQEMKEMGYDFPSDSAMESQIKDDLTLTRFANASDTTDPNNPEDNSGNTLPDQNRSNNRNRPNESSGTESTTKSMRDSSQKTRDA